MSFDVIDPGDDWNEQERQISARRMAQYSAEAIAAARDVTRKYVLFPELKTVLAAFDRVYQLSRDLNLPQGVLVTGPPGSSKTSVADYFMRSLPPAADVVEGFGAVYLRMRPGISAGLLVSQFLNAVRHPLTYVRHDRVASMRDIACEALRHKGTRLVFVDEAQCLSPRSRARMTEDRDTSVCNLLREVMDRSRVALVLLADHRMPELEQVDRALADRVSVRVSLAYFGNDSTWASFLGELARSVKTVSLVHLGDESIRSATHAATGGCRRTAMRLVTEAVLVAIDAKASVVERSHFQIAFQRAAGPGHMVQNPYGNH